MIPNKRMPTVMGSGHEFSKTPSASIQRSVFDRSHGYKTTFDAGLLIPIFVDWILPGDTMALKMTALARLTTPLRPFMDNMYLESFFFFVPDRLVWTNFPKFMGEQANPGDSIAYTTPVITVTAGQYPLHSIGDYMGLNTAQHVVGTFSHSALPIRAYALIYNQWFRDENLINSTLISLGDGPDSSAFADDYPFKRGKRHDYFTSALPFLQKGSAVALPIVGSAPVRATSPTNPHVFSVQDSTGAAYWTVQNTAINSDHRVGLFGGAGALNNRLYAVIDATNTLLTINEMRQAVGLQQFLERDARGGTRYKELVFSHFRVVSDDARLDRAEYLGGGSTPVVVSPIAQQTQSGLTGGTTMFGSLGGIGAAVASGHGFNKSFTEHGTIIGIINVRADLTYSQGMERHWSHSTRVDRFWPVLEELGEQAILNKEIYMIGALPQDTNVFGYQERYAEYRYKPSKLTGLMAPTAAGSVPSWHLSEHFGALPTLGQTFIEDQTETVLDTRVAVPAEPDFYLDAFFDYKCARPMRVYGVPGLRRL